MKKLESLFNLAAKKVFVGAMLLSALGLLCLSLLSANTYKEIKQKNLNHIRIGLSYNEVTPIDEEHFLSSLKEGTGFFDYVISPSKDDGNEEIICSRNNCYAFTFKPLTAFLLPSISIYVLVILFVLAVIFIIQKKFNSVISRELKTLNSAVLAGEPLTGVTFYSQEVYEVARVLEDNKTLSNELTLKKELAHDMKAPIEALKFALSMGAEQENSNLLKATLERLQEMNLKFLNKDGIGTKGCQLSSVIHSSIDEIKLLSPDAVLMVEGCPELTVQCDKGKLQRALINIFKNSIEAVNSRKCKIKIKVEESRGKVRVLIEDSGPGYPLEVLSSFQQGKAIKSSKSTGHGIGLSQISNMIKEIQGNFNIYNSKLGAMTEIIF